MRKILLGGVAAALLAVAAPAQAHPTYHYEGGCGVITLSDGSDDDETTWTNQTYAVVVATDAVTGAPTPAPISVECDMYKNGVYQGTILSASGTGIVVAAPQYVYVYQASPDDIITICDRVTVGGEQHTDCGDSTLPLPPEPLPDLIEGILDLVDQIVLEHGDPTVCEVSRALAPGVPGVLDITPDGDVYVVSEFFWDCYPYAA